MPKLRVLPAESLVPDPDVQLEWTLEEKRVAWLREEWNPAYACVLVVVPLPDGRFGIVDGRHRFLAGCAAGEKQWRCDVHEELSTIEEKAALKLALDRQRRRVSRLEHFEERLKMKDPDSLAIQKIVRASGFDIGRLRGGKPYTRIGSVGALEFLFEFLMGIHGKAGLERVMALNAKFWLETPKSNTGEWLRALGLLVRDGYDEGLTPSSESILADQIPARLLAFAEGENLLHGRTGQNDSTWGSKPYILARELRRKAKMKVRPVIQKPGGVNAYPLS